MNTTGKILRIIAIILLGMTAAMNVLGGIGTSCAAFSSNVGYRLAFKELLDYRWLYQILVVTTTLLGIAGIWATIKLARGGARVFYNALIILIIGCILGGIHYFASMTLRGEAAPANVKFFTNVFTLVVFVVFMLPGIREKIDFTAPGGRNETNVAAGMAAILAGALTLTVFHWAGSSHTYFGQNWTYVFFGPLVVAGMILTLSGLYLIGRAIINILSQDAKTGVLMPVEGQ